MTAGAIGFRLSPLLPPPLFPSRPLIAFSIVLYARWRSRNVRVRSRRLEEERNTERNTKCFNIFEFHFNDTSPSISLLLFAFSRRYSAQKHSRYVCNEKNWRERKKKQFFYRCSSLVRRSRIIITRKKKRRQKSRGHNKIVSVQRRFKFRRTPDFYY